MVIVGRGLAALTLIHALGAHAYELETHADISEIALGSSDLRLPTTLTRLGLRPLPLGDATQRFINSQGQALSINELVRFGARWEDDAAAAQALRHFYDPVNDRALDIGGAGSSLIAKSPDWALEDVTTYIPQINSYRDAREYLYTALTRSGQSDRRKYFGLVFQSLGHVIHHLQDMAQPQHVRNEPHCDHWMCEALVPRAYAPSQYEKYTDLDVPGDRLRQIRVNLPFLEAGSSPVYPGPNAATVAFKKPRDFWRTTTPGSSILQGQGIAEYTNRNFFSAATIALPYLSPEAPTVTEWYSPQDVRNVEELLPGTTLRGKVRFWSRPVNDAVTGTIETNERAITDGLLDSDLAAIYSTTSTNGYLVYALNRFTFDAAHRFLIPRAVAYSAGLINYFFRGQLDIRQPDEGAYAVLDHAVNNQIDADGFTKVKVKVRNTTPGGTDANGTALVEPIPEQSSGSFVAIVKFHRNTCYLPDLSGEYGSPNVDWHTCRSAAEELVVSAPLPAPMGINQTWQAMTFDFSRGVIPINATDVFLQVVYRGPLGEESDAIIVATRDISEPTYNYVFNTWDQFLYCANGVISSVPACQQIYTFEQSFCQQAEPQLTLAQCQARNGRTTKVRANPIAHRLPGYDPDNPQVPPDETIYDMTREAAFDPLFSLPTPVGAFTRVAVLTDLAPADPYLVVNELGVGNMAEGFNWSEGQGVPTINQLDPDSGNMVKNRSYARARGVFVDTTPYSWNSSLNDWVLLTNASAPSPPPLTLVPSLILNFSP